MPDAIPVPPEAVTADPHPEGNPALAAAVGAILSRRLVTGYGSGLDGARRAVILLDALPDAAAAITAAAPLIAASERERILALLDTWRCSCGADDCAAYDTRDQIASLIGDTR